MASAKARARGRPIPVPSIAPCSSPSRSNGSKMRSRSAAGIPGPVSATARLTWSELTAWQVMVTVPPWRLYLIALEIRLTRIWRSRCRSALTARPAHGQSWLIVIERSAARGAMSWQVSSTTGATATGSTDRLNSPDSILAMSISSLISASRWRPARENALDRVPVLLAEVGQLQQLSETEDRVQRGAQLMAGAGQERVLSLGRRQRPIPGGDQLRGPADQELFRAHQGVRQPAELIAGAGHGLQRLSFSQPVGVRRGRRDAGGNARGEQRDADQAGQDAKGQADDADRVDGRFQPGDISAPGRDDRGRALGQGWRSGSGTRPCQPSRSPAPASAAVAEAPVLIAERSWASSAIFLAAAPAAACSAPLSPSATAAW